MRKITDSMRQLEAALGYKYTLMLIDEVWCLYRDLGNGYDIEINLKGTRKNALNATVYVWQIRDKLKVIERIDDIREMQELKNILRCVVNKTNKLATNRNKVYKPILQAV